MIIPRLVGEENERHPGSEPLQVLGIIMDAGP